MPTGNFWIKRDHERKSELEFPFAPDVFGAFFSRCKAAIDLDAWVEFFDEGFKVAESHVFAWKNIERFADPCFLYSTLGNTVDSYGKRFLDLFLLLIK